MAKLPALETLLPRYSDPIVKLEVTRRLTPMVLRYAKKYAQGAHEILDDLVAVGLMGLAIALPRWRAGGGSNVRNWCQYEVNHQMRKYRGTYERQRAEHPYTEDEGLVCDWTHIARGVEQSREDYAAPNPEQCLQRMQTLERVWKEVSSNERITERQRTAMLMVYGRGLTTLQASRTLGCSDETVRQELRRAVKVLKGALTDGE